MLGIIFVPPQLSVTHKFFPSLSTNIVCSCVPDVSSTLAENTVMVDKQENKTAILIIIDKIRFFIILISYSAIVSILYHINFNLSNQQEHPHILAKCRWGEFTN